jgi:succinate dehydrogenase / fumarate reductase flavoprotein subunit
VTAVIAGQKPDARRPPELLTRDVVARAIAQEVREGRGSPHGGAFLDIASKRTAEGDPAEAPRHVQQFHELADVDITRDPMEVGPTTHYVMGGVRVDPETQAATVPGSSRPARSRADSTARTGSAGTR